MLPPFNQIKKQTMAIYGQRLATLGYVALGFDHIGYGDREGNIRNNENIFIKIERIEDAISRKKLMPDFIIYGNCRVTLRPLTV